MQETALWDDWDIRLVSTHTNGTALARIGKFAAGYLTFLAQLVFERPGVVHLHAAAYGSFVRKGLLLWTAKAIHLPVVLHMHGADFLTFLADAPRPFPRLIRLTLERADALIALGDAWAAQLRTIAPEANIVVIPNAVRPAAAVDQRVDGPVSVLFLGEIGDRKGTFTLLEAWAKVLTDCPQEASTRLTIVGDGEVDRARLRVVDLDLDETVDVRDWMPHSKVMDLLATTQILVLPSHDEGQPMAILEAMARGICVVASTVGGIPELLSDGCGTLVAPDDVDGLAAAMIGVICDEERRSVIGRRAADRIRSHFDLDVVSRRFDEMYAGLVG
jgi:glycosyltransferase involved in cell wall biosynthesis